MTYSLLQERRVDVNGVGTVVLEGGDPSQTSAVVFVHGNPGSGQDWMELAQDAARFGRVVVFDMPGFGFSFPRGSYRHTIAEGAEVVLGIMDALGTTDGDVGVVNVPVLSVWGDRDRTHRKTEPTSVREHAGKLQSETFAGCGHFPHLERTERFVDLVREALPRWVSG